MDRFRDDAAIQVFISTDAGGVGLNLQTAAVLVNLDMPWNPAVLDQRIARIHRLGQRQKVQILLLVSAASYEERVMELIQGKRHLFDNVVDPAATEDVVSVSKRLAEVLAEDLAGKPELQGEPAAIAAEAVVAPEPEPATIVIPPSPAPSPPTAPAWTRMTWSCAASSPSRTPLVHASNASSPPTARAGDAAGCWSCSTASTPRTTSSPATSPARSRSRSSTGAHSAVSTGSAPPRRSPTARPCTSPAGPSRPRLQVHPLARKAAEKLEAASLLAQQGCPGPALELLLGALLAAAARRAESGPGAESATGRHLALRRGPAGRHPRPSGRRAADARHRPGPGRGHGSAGAARWAPRRCAAICRDGGASRARGVNGQRLLRFSMSGIFITGTHEKSRRGYGDEEWKHG